MRFELDHLESYDDEALLAELRRVAELVGTPKLSIEQFSEHAKVHGSTLKKRFGSWTAALKAAGLSDRIEERNRRREKDEIIDLIKSTAATLKTDSLRLMDFETQTGISGKPVRRLFGSWAAALKEAGLSQNALGRRFSDKDCFENMLLVWTYYGRPPHHDEMREPPSMVGPKVYVRRWGTWREALEAFVTRVNDGTSKGSTEANEPPEVAGARPKKDDRGSRQIPLSLRYHILKRDNFRCVVCGDSPAINSGVVLHVDHIKPWARGGATVADNLRTTCERCNLGKGASYEQ